jgi:hypothetical protein
MAQSAAANRYFRCDLSIDLDEGRDRRILISILKPRERFFHKGL